MPLLEKGKVPLREIYEARYLCLRCVKMQVDRKTPDLISECQAFTEFCFQWKENKDVSGWKVQCWGFLKSQEEWEDIQDEIHKYMTESRLKLGYSNHRAEEYYESWKRGMNRRLRGHELIGLRELYYEETHPRIPGGSQSDSVGKSKGNPNKRAPLLDGDLGDWEPLGLLRNFFGEYNHIEETKKNKAKKNSKAEDSSKMAKDEAQKEEYKQGYSGPCGNTKPKGETEVVRAKRKKGKKKLRRTF